ncbi:L,D-transpeptidase [Arcanobacterium buesumense]|uniref:L,D-transpeptidase n=1 Tax=Arcanobacterium buesumense TaxID=2722751 RepID=A0A6H2EKL8_9ACTO|nr:L,D-transpeptidase [Arcanobacterium buesumense]QJC21744.1 L,D-transpeptidase [Arcanobacterium buesumense]
MTKKRLAIFGSIGVLGVFIIATLTFVGYFAISGRALPHTHVGELNVGGMSKAEIEAKLKSNATTITADISGDGVNQVTANLASMGAEINTSKTAQQAVDERRSAFGYLSSIFSSSRIDPVLTFADESTLADFAYSLTEGQNSQAIPTEPKIEAQDGVFSVIPGTDGHGVSVDEIKRVAKALATAQKSLPITVTTTELKALASTEQLEKVADRANQLIDDEVSITVGDDVITADAPTKASWVTFDDDDLQLNKETVTAWVTENTKEAEGEEVVGVRYKNSAGDVIRVATEPVGKRTVSNLDDVVSIIIDGMNAQTPVSASITITEGEKQWEDRLIAPGAEELAYPAAEGEKWIDVNLSNFTVVGYEGAKAVVGPILLVPGATDTPTVTGTFKVWHKMEKQTMRGTNLDGTPYETKDVPWIMYFHGDYAIHGAPWFKTFGYHAGAYGSHGCVNIAVDDAHTLYDWAPMGTVVVSHY